MDIKTKLRVNRFRSMLRNYKEFNLKKLLQSQKLLHQKLNKKNNCKKLSDRVSLNTKWKKRKEKTKRKKFKKNKSRSPFLDLFLL